MSRHAQTQCLVGHARWEVFSRDDGAQTEEAMRRKGDMGKELAQSFHIDFDLCFCHLDHKRTSPNDPNIKPAISFENTFLASVGTHLMLY